MGGICAVSTGDGISAVPAFLIQKIHGEEYNERRVTPEKFVESRIIAKMLK